MNTEAEAKTKWCPFVKFSDEGADAYSMNNRGEVLHRDVDPKTISHCIGSQCMAWRGFTDFICTGGNRPEGSGWAVTQDKTDSHGQRFVTWGREVGFCGAFGRPE